MPRLRKVGTPHTFNLAANDVGHFGGCESYDFDSGSCAIQDNEGLKGDHEWKWDVAAVAAMSAEAVRSTDTGFCRAWFADDNH